MPVLRVADADGVRTITLDRPERRNALSHEVLEELEVVLADTATWRGRAVVLEGAGTAFSAGADLKETRPEYDSWSEFRVEAWRWNRLVDDIETLPQVTIARLQGPAIGGGLVLALACDLRVAAPEATLRIPELALGLPFVMGGVQRLVREVGLSRAREAILTGRPLPAVEAHGWGLVHRVGDVDVEVAALVAELGAVPEGLLHMTKHALRSIGRLLSPMDLSWADPELLLCARRPAEAPAPAASAARPLNGS